MKSILLSIVLCCTGVLTAQNSNQKAFARIEGNGFVILGDTLKLKSEIANLMFSDRAQKPSLNVAVRKSQTIGEKSQDYYFVSLTNKAQNITVAKWLERIGNDLMLIDTFNNENYWQLLTTACIGKDDCSPQVAILESTKTWTCGTKLSCSKEETNCMKISGMQAD